MLAINTDTFLIEMTRGDSASIVFAAVDKDGNLWNPSETTDRLTFAVAKKWGAEPLFEITNEYDGVEAYKEVSIDGETYNAHPTWYYTESGGIYTQCTAEDAYDSDETYYMRDCDEFWTITITTEDWLDNGAEKFKFTDYVYDVQILTTTGADTIIGKTDTITPTFRVWGEAAKEGE